jgi:DNA-binding transcriptional regulator GbsR (MarR family)
MKRIYAVLYMRGELSTSQIALAVKLNRGHVSRVLGRMLKSKLLNRRRATDGNDIHTTWTLWSVKRVGVAVSNVRR